MDDSPPQRHAPPHIRLNSGSGDLLNMNAESAQSSEDSQQAPQSRPQTARQPSARSLTSGSRPGTAPSLRTAASNASIYGQQGNTPADSAELLLPPRRSQRRRFRDDPESPVGPRSPSVTGFNSRRTSWSSESAGSRDSRYGGPFVSPFDDSRAPSRAGSDEEGVNTQTVSEKYNILPSAGLLLFPEDVEKDDYLHNPDPNEKEGKMNCADLLSPRGMANVGGLAVITLGLLTLFIVYPVLTFVQQFTDPAGSDACSLDADCLSSDVALLTNVRTGLIDPDTPSSAKHRTSATGKKQTLVFSDEFNDEDRTFYDGDDAYFQAVDLWYGVTEDLEWYDPDAITTANGTLAIRFDAFQSHDLNYRSGMLQSWNQMCFKSGYLQASISLPGAGDTIGFWPGFWAMGNLGRPGYAATTDGMWPYSYHDGCDAGITPNQSDPDGFNMLPGMRLPACTCEGEDHPTPGTSRSAPEIDALEASVTYLDPPAGAAIGSASQSYQIAPFDIFWRPNTEWIEVYDHHTSAMNSYQGGVYQQALSTVTNLNNEWYNGNAYQTYGFEYEPGDEGYVVWDVGGVQTWKVEANAIGPSGNVGQRTMPEEPMALVMNFGMSTGFATLNLTGLAPLMPATMRFDYVRIYQDDDGDGEVTCDPKGYTTTDYITEHPTPYADANLTEWSEANYTFPLNSFMSDCTEATNSSSSSKARKERLKAKRELKEKQNQKRSWLPSWGSGS